MPVYRLVLADDKPLPQTHMHITGRLVRHVTCDHFADAGGRAQDLAARYGKQVLQVGITRDRVVVDDQQIAEQLHAYLGEELGWTCDLAAFAGYEESSVTDFLSWVIQVCAALAETNLVPDLSMTLSADAQNMIDYTLIEVLDADGTYHAQGVDIRDLTTDRSASGIQGLTCIAKALIEIAENAR